MPELPAQMILRKAEANGGIQSLLALRAVNKSWRDSCTEYRGDISAALQHSTDLKWLVKALPSMTGLTATSIAENTDLSPLSACPQLTSVSLVDPKEERKDEDEYEEDSNGFERETEKRVNLAALPQILRELTLSHMWGEPTYLKYDYCRGGFGALVTAEDLDPEDEYDVYNALRKEKVCISRSPSCLPWDCNACQGRGLTIIASR